MISQAVNGDTLNELQAMCFYRCLHSTCWPQDGVATAIYDGL